METVIVYLVLDECKIFSRTLRVYERLRVFENKVLRPVWT
jgi:hypothetical protein